MASNPQAVGYGLAGRGWTGGATITVGLVVASVVPAGAVSAVRVWLDLLAAARSTHGGEWRGWADASQRLVIVGPSTFTLAATGVTQTRLAATGGPYAGATEYTMAAAHYLGGYPTLGVELDGSPLGSDDTQPSSTGATAPPRVVAGEQATMRLGASWSDIDDVESDIGLASQLDVWSGGRDCGRWAVESMRRVRRGPLLTHVALDVSMSGLGAWP